MKIRKLRRTDIPAIDRIYRQFFEQEFSLPSLNNTITTVVVEDENGIISFGVIKLLAEAIIVTDLGRNGRDRMGALEKLVTEARRSCSQHDISQLHAFIQDPKFSGLLKKHYGFKTATGEAIVMET